MKKMIFLLALLTVLSGCASPVYETMGNVEHVGQPQHLARQILLSFPEDASILTSSGPDALYLCNGYSMELQIVPSGDLAATIRCLSGYDPEKLTILESSCGDHARIDWVWTAAGEQGDVVCRGAVLDDGNFHYCLCLSADAETAPGLSDAWNSIFASFCLEEAQLS